MKVRHANFYPFSCPLHPMVRHALVDGPIGWRFNILWGLRFTVLGVDGSPRGRHELRSFIDRLSSIYEVRHVSLFDWIFPRIEVSLHLPCMSYIYITLLLFYFSTFQLKHTVKVPSSTLLESDPSNICTRLLYNRHPSVIQTWWVFSFHKSCKCIFYFLRPFLHTHHHF